MLLFCLRILHSMVVMAAYDGTTGFMTNVTCGLTGKKLGSAPCPTLVIEYETTLLYGSNKMNMWREIHQVLWHFLAKLCTKN